MIGAEALEQDTVDLAQEVVDARITPVGVLRFLQVALPDIAHVPVRRQAVSDDLAELAIEQVEVPRAVRVAPADGQHQHVEVVRCEQVGDRCRERERVAHQHPLQRRVGESQHTRRPGRHVARDPGSASSRCTLDRVLEAVEPGRELLRHVAIEAELRQRIARPPAEVAQPRRLATVQTVRLRRERDRHRHPSGGVARQLRGQRPQFLLPHTSSFASLSG